MNDLKATLNAAWPRLSADRKKLNPTFLAIVKAGFKAERIDDDDEASVARDNQILTDAQVGAILRAASEIDQDQALNGDLYRIVVCLAATGARYAQVRRMRAGDLQVAERRLMVPGSYKGRGGNGGSVPVPAGDDAIEELLPAIVGRPNDAPLFARWLHQLEAGSIAWKKSERGPWKRAELTRPWQAKGKADLLLKLADECDRGLLFTAEWLSARPYRKIEHSPQGDVKAGFVCDPFYRRR